MSHEFETGFVVREKAWHGLATVLPENPSVKDALKHAGLDWDVLESPITASVTEMAIGEDGSASEQFKEVPLKGWKALLRGSDYNPMGVVTDTFKPFQNTDCFSWFQPIIDDGLAVIETAGSLQEGRKVWVQAKYSDALEVKDGDSVIPYLLLANGHDGKMSLRLMNTPIRVVCWNTMQASGAKEDADGANPAKSGYAITHSGDIVAKANMARKAIVAMNRDFKVTVDAYRQMAKMPVTEEYVRELAKQLWDREYVQANELIHKFRQRQEQEKGKIRKDTMLKIAELEKLLETESRTEKKVVDAFHNSPGCEGKTKWDAFNAVTYQIDHASQGSAHNRLTSSWFGNGARKRAKAFEMLQGSK